MYRQIDKCKIKLLIHFIKHKFIVGCEIPNLIAYHNMYSKIALVDRQR